MPTLAGTAVICVPLPVPERARSRGSERHRLAAFPATAAMVRRPRSFPEACSKRATRPGAPDKLGRTLFRSPARAGASAKGIRPALFEVCRLRDVPIITFVNKLDPDGAIGSTVGRNRAVSRTRRDPGLLAKGMGADFSAPADYCAMRALDRERPLFSPFLLIMRFTNVEIQAGQRLGSLFLNGDQLFRIKAQRR
jgi:hypothetical protein